MKAVTWMLLLGLFVASATGCATGPVITADYDRSADFGAYRTFAFAEPLGTDSAGYESLVSQTMKAAARREMEKRGYVFAQDDPDLLINFGANLAQQLRVSQVPAMPPMYYGYRGGYYGGWPGYANQTMVDQYVEGTINIDVIDARRKKLVWEGVAVGRVQQREREAQRAALDAVVTDTFAKYPFRASP
jgi:hypothetical protein